jgi:hypothetical protein
MAKSAVEDAYEAGLNALEGYPLFTLPQMLRLINYFGGSSGSEGNERAKHTVTKNAFRLRARDEPFHRIRFRKKQEVLYARTAPEREAWLPAQQEMIVKALERTEARVAHVINTGGSVEQGQLGSANDNDTGAVATAAVAAAIGATRETGE